MGGAQYQAKILVDRLVATRNYDIYYLARRTNPKFEPKGYKVIKIGDPNGIRRYGFFFDAIKLLSVLRRIKPDVIYQQVGCAYTGVAAYYARTAGCRMIWRISSDKSLFFPDRRRTRDLLPHRYIERKLLEYGITHADVIATQTEYQNKLLQRHYNRSATKLIRNFHPLPQERIEKCQPIQVLWVSHLKRLKQPELFVRLAGDLQNVKDVEFIMVGAPADNPSWCNQLLRDIDRENNLLYLGERTQHEVNALFAKAHIFVNTSLYEGFPNTFIQAWMRKVPVVSLNVDPDSILKNTEIGLLSTNYDTMREHIRKLVQDPTLRNKMGERAQAFAFKNYSEKNLDELIELLDA